MPRKTEEEVLLTVFYGLGTSQMNRAAHPRELKRQKPREQFVCRRCQQPPTDLTMEWHSPVHTSGSHNLMATSTGHGADLLLAGRDSGCPVALSQNRNIKPGGTLKMSP